MVTVTGYVTTLWCQAQGAPAPVITWIKNGKLLQNTTSVTYKPERNAEGVYRCLANNFFGSTQSKTLKVVRQGKYLIRKNKLN